METKIYTRRIDELGRIVLPREMRAALGMSEKTPVDICVDGDSIQIKKNNNIPQCCLCGETESKFKKADENNLCIN